MQPRCQGPGPPSPSGPDRGQQRQIIEHEIDWGLCGLKIQPNAGPPLFHRDEGEKGLALFSRAVSSCTLCRPIYFSELNGRCACRCRNVLGPGSQRRDASSKPSLAFHVACCSHLAPSVSRFSPFWMLEEDPSMASQAPHLCPVVLFAAKVHWASSDLTSARVSLGDRGGPALQEGKAGRRWDRMQGGPDGSGRCRKTSRFGSDWSSRNTSRMRLDMQGPEEQAPKEPLICRLGYLHWLLSPSVQMVLRTSTTCHTAVQRWLDKIMHRTSVTYSSRLSTRLDPSPRAVRITERP